MAAIELSAYKRKMAQSRYLNKRRYVPNLAQLQACCTRNYASLLRLVDGLGGKDTLLFSHEGQTLTLAVEEQAPYTSTIRLSQQRSGLPDYLTPAMRVRMYHDARMAEVLSSQQISGVRARYDYPNCRMHQQDEKMQINQFLAEWVTFCLEHGVGPEMNWA